ncbi:unnamed protein product [Macrosiphum euphorbiae]|uniref:Uncharacterized protein n=1 Tax=Macrosiphum euphorbiae TaxID=13131 RepID=A0AAV0XZS2_9HEMI|nr:unnamed protein product [Macrosiphum euphorbiae]
MDISVTYKAREKLPKNDDNFKISKDSMINFERIKGILEIEQKKNNEPVRQYYKLKERSPSEKYNIQKLEKEIRESRVEVENIKSEQAR